MVLYILGGKSHGLLKRSCCLDWGFCRCLLSPFDFWCNLKSILIIFIHFMCYVCMCECVHSTPHGRRSEDNLQELFFLHHVDPGDWTQVGQASQKMLYPLSYMASLPGKNNRKTLELNDLYLLVRVGYWNARYCSIGINLWLHIKKYLFMKLDTVMSLLCVHNYNTLLMYSFLNEYDVTFSVSAK